MSNQTNQGRFQLKEKKANLEVSAGNLLSSIYKPYKILKHRIWFSLYK